MRRWWGMLASSRLRLEGDWAVLGPLLFAGALLRVAMMLAVRPITYGLYDSGTYMAAVSGTFPRLFWDVHHPVGYPIFLAIVSPVVRSGTGLAALQHLMGLGAVALLFFAGRAFGAPRWAAAIGAGAYALSIDVIALEHSVLSEAIYMPLIALYLFAASRVYQAERGRRTALWAAVLGLAAGISYTARYPGAALFIAAPVIALALTRANYRRRLGAATVAGLGVAVVVVSYLGAQNAQMGIGWQLFPGQGWNHYSSIAATADCSRFTPPPGTRVLCQSAAQRRGKTPEFYSWDARSPARRLEPRGFPYSDARFEAFADAASVSQHPGHSNGFLGVIGGDVTSLVRDAGAMFGPLQWAPQLNYLNAPEEAHEQAVARGLLDIKPMSFHAPLQPLTDLRPFLRVSGGVAFLALLALVAALPRLGLARGVFGIAMLCVVLAWVHAGTQPRYAVPVYELSLGLLPLAAAGLTGVGRYFGRSATSEQARAAVAPQPLVGNGGERPANAPERRRQAV